MIIPLSLIGIFPAAQAQTITPTITGDPFTIGEGDDMLYVGMVRFNVVNADNMTRAQILIDTTSNFDSINERIIFEPSQSRNDISSILIDSDVTLADLQETIGSGVTGPIHFNYNVTELTDMNGIVSIYLVISDGSDGNFIVDVSSTVPGHTAVPLVSDGDPQGQVTITDTSTRMFDSNFADKSIGLVIDFNNNVPLSTSTRYGIAADFSTLEIPLGQETTYQNLVNVIAARNLAITQQNVIVDYWSDSNNPFADDRTLAQARIDYANAHITQSTIQRDSYQAQLDQLTNP